MAVIALNSPPVNVLSGALLEELSARLQEVERNVTVRAIVLASDCERAFAAGASIHEMAPLEPREADRHAARGQGITRQLEACSLPIVAAVHGACLGGGCEIVQACDFVLAAEDATFGQPEITLGVMPGWGGTQRLPRRVGAQTARAWIFLGRSVGSAEAKAAGLVWRLVPRAELRSEAIRLAEELAQKPARALAAAKEALNYAIDRSLGPGLDRERHLWAALFGTLDQREGMHAFLEKRAPTFVARDAGRAGASRTPRHFSAAPRVHRRASLAHRARRRRSKT